MSLNVQEIKGFRAADKSYKKYDSRGLLLLVKPNGSKLWYFKYRFAGKEKKLPIGAFPEVSLSQARQLRDRARLKVYDKRCELLSGSLSPIGTVHCCQHLCG